ncbi:PAS domain-containing protein [Pontibacter sp. FD36]|uniref:sensor histidine kinase n=1 Tax=Pontibacter sp. FD36 TaxID=2789860 RepID=UPI0018ABC3FF|nr:ATP-binding protein [Pontibacter sp. FD36]MBF8963556.1 PAS domain-containing protein [Pontibacter sp. FD36]
MKFKRLEFGLLIRFTLLLGMMLLTSLYLVQFTWLQVGSGILVMLAQVWELANYVTRSNYEMAKFLQAVRQRDFTQQFNENPSNHSLRPLHQAFNQISHTFKQLEIEKEAQFQYMQTILQLIDTGIMAYDEEGQVEWVNDAFKNILGIPHLKSLDNLERRYPQLLEAILELQPGENKLLKQKLPQGSTQLLLSATAFTMQRHPLTLVAIKNVSSAVDETETEAWQKLLRVMTHEIMNSVAPIASLADSLGKHLQAEREEQEAQGQLLPNHELLQDTEEGISIIKKRSEGLLRFAHFYRNLNKSHQILLTTVYVKELLNSIDALMRPRLEEQGIALSCQVSSPDLTLNGDVNLLEQVLINLILNAARAVKEVPEPQVWLTAGELENGKVYIKVRDNGTGIPEELMESIFIPFFTSHKDGSGIGLSLAKHIMLLHKGSIQVESQEGAGSVFTLTF